MLEANPLLLQVGPTLLETTFMGMLAPLIFTPVIAP